MILDDVERRHGEALGSLTCGASRARLVTAADDASAGRERLPCGGKVPRLACGWLGCGDGCG